MIFNLCIGGGSSAPPNNTVPTPGRRRNSNEGRNSMSVSIEDDSSSELSMDFSACSNERYIIPFRSKMNNTEDNSVNTELQLLLKSKIDHLNFFQRLSYGFGHVFNDLCAAMWFSYLLFYFQIILEMESATAGFLLMIGQVSDALATPVAGWAVDTFGTRSLWHLMGTIIVLINFPLVFTSCEICEKGHEFQILFYHIVVIVLFQIGWAIVQISHLSMIPNLTRIPAIRSELTAIRYTASVSSGLIAYIITWLMLRTDEQKPNTIGPQDYYRFREINIVVMIIGAVACVVFYSGIKWKHFINKGFSQSDVNQTPNISIRKILLSPHIYQISLLYVASRLYVTLNLVYMPLYLDERVNTSVPAENLRESLASVPLVSFIASFITSVVLKNRTQRWGNKLVYLFGSLISFSTCIWIGLYIGQATDVSYVYGVAFLIGIGSSVTIIASLCLTAEIIGSNINQGASVYSIVTFADKLICGLIVVLIERLKCEEKIDCPEYYRYVLAYVSGGAAFFGLLTLATLILPQRSPTRVSPAPSSEINNF